ILTLCDALLGWLLYLPADAVLVVVGVLTVLVMMVIRRVLTDQDLLSRADADLKRIKELIRLARREKDRDAIKRYRRTRGEISLKKLRAEGKPMLAAVIPIVLLATWAMARLDYRPPKPDSPVQLRAYTPLVEAGGVMHVVPEEGLEATPGWVSAVEPVADGGETYGLAKWRLRPADGEPGRWRLTLRLGERTLRHEITFGERFYGPPLVVHDDGFVTELRMERMKLLGVVPGIDALMMPPWLVGYLVVVFPVYFTFKRLFGVH
ncbi:MAG: EMC3/TMCO1 family protein, partial [Planctomycetota bacterium]